MFNHILLIINMFRSLSRPSSGQQYDSSKNTTKRQIVYMVPLSVITDVSHSPYGHKISSYILLKTNKIGFIFVCN